MKNKLKQNNNFKNEEIYRPTVRVSVTVIVDNEFNPYKSVPPCIFDIYPTKTVV